MPDIKKISIGNVTYDIKDATARTQIPYIAGTQSGATNVWTGVAPFAALVTGQVIVYHLPVAGTSTAAALELTLATSPATTTGAIPVLMLSNSAVTTAFAAGCDIFMVYNGTAWKVSACYDALPAAPQTDGNALVSVNGEWTKQAGYGYTSTASVLPETEITVPSGTTFYVYTAEGIGSSLNTETINVMFDDVEYVLPRHNDSYGYVYGDESFGYHQSSEYPVEILAPQQEGAPAYIGFNETGTGNAHTISIVSSVLAHIDNKYINLPIKSGTGAGSAVVGNTTLNTATGSTSYAEGYDCHSQGDYSHSEGYQSYANGTCSHVEGYINYAVGDYSHAEGYASYAYDYAHAEGSSTARGAVSHAEGNTVANGAYSHTSGYHNIPDSYDDWDEWTANTPYAVGDKVKRTITSSGTTTIYGYICKTANSDSTFSAWNWTECNGRMNYIEIVGNAMTNNTYSNARTLDWDGNGWYAGKVSVGTSANPPVPTADNDLTTKQYVDAHGLPSVTSSDNGKIPRVVNGAWALTTIASANGVSF